MEKNKKIYQGTDVLEVLEGARNYNAWIGSEIEPYLVDPILEVGSGIGNISEYFIKRDLTLSDMDKDLIDRLKKKHKKNKTLKFMTLNVENKVSVSLKNSFNSVFAVNVFEHIEDDFKALKNVHSMLSKKGTLILLVPAKERAYTPLDKKLGHYRRYEKEILKTKIVKAGFTIECIYFFNFIGLFSWIIRDRLDKGKGDLKPTQVAIFDKIVPVLRFLEKRVRPMIGISLIVVATKK